MEKTKGNLVDVSRLYTLRRYAEMFGVNYSTLYLRYLGTLSGKNKNPLNLVEVSGNSHIYVTIEEEKELLKNKGEKK